MTQDADKHRDDDALAAEYVTGVLPHGERAAFAARLEAEPALREKVRFWDEQLAPLADGIEPVAPPAGVLARIEGELFASAAPRKGWWESLGFWRGLSAASLAGLAVVAALYIAAPRTDTGEAGPTYVSQLAGEDNAVRVVALYDPREGVLRINRTDGAPASGRDFELWLIEGGDAPISMGVLPADRSGVLPVAEALRPRLASAVLAITDEPAGGSPTGVATGPIVATGEVSSI